MNILMENWALIVVAIGVIALVVVGVWYFFALPTNKQKEKVKQWLLWAVVKAETELGANTGQLKLAMVYDLFLSKFPTLSKFLSFATFSKLVDSALDKMKEIISTNATVSKLIESNTVECEIKQ